MLAVHHNIPTTPERKPAPVCRSRAAMAVKRCQSAGRSQAKVTSSRVSEIEIALRRKKHADAERCRSRRKEHEVVRMSEHVNELERTFHALKERKQQQQRMYGPTIQLSAVERAGLDYVDALAKSGHLRREKLYLHARIQDLGIINTAMDMALADFGVPVTSGADVDKRIHQCQVYKKISDAQCRALTNEVVETSRTLQVAGKLADTAFGWSVEQTFNNKAVSFRLSKTFPDQDIEQLIQRTWHSLHNAEFCGLKKQHTAQHLHEDALVLRQTIRDNESSTCLSLVFRTKTERGWLLGCKTLPTAMLSISSRERAQPANQVHWVQIEQTNDGNCQVTFGGLIERSTSKLALQMLADVPISVLHWELGAVGPLVALESPKSDLI